MAAMSVTIGRSSWLFYWETLNIIFFMSFLLGLSDFSEKTSTVFYLKTYLTTFWKLNGRRDLRFLVPNMYTFT